MAGATEHSRIIESSVAATVATGALAFALLFAVHPSEYCLGSCYILHEGISSLSIRMYTESRLLEAKLKITTVIIV